LPRIAATVRTTGPNLANPSETNAIEKPPDGYTYLDPAEFPQASAADLPPEEAEFEENA